MKDPLALLFPMIVQIWPRLTFWTYLQGQGQKGQQGQVPQDQTKPQSQPQQLQLKDQQPQQLNPGSGQPTRSRSVVKDSVWFVA